MHSNLELSRAVECAKCVLQKGGQSVNLNVTGSTTVRFCDRRAHWPFYPGHLLGYRHYMYCSNTYNAFLSDNIKLFHFI